MINGAVYNVSFAIPNSHRISPTVKKERPIQIMSQVRRQRVERPKGGMGGKRTSHNHADTGNEGDKLGLYAVGICAGAKGRIVGARGEADAREEAVVGEDGEGVCEEAEDVDEVAYEEHLGWCPSVVFPPLLCLALSFSSLT